MASQKKLSDFSDSALSRVRTKDMVEAHQPMQGIEKCQAVFSTGDSHCDFIPRSHECHDT